MYSSHTNTQLLLLIATEITSIGLRNETDVGGGNVDCQTTQFMDDERLNL